ncbi:MAG: hypothetical protein ACI4XE_06765 [Acutalibacteraceae bacterium]
MSVAEIFEAIMLVCFGLSWPMSVIKNIKAKSAKNMSLQFILLICFGYVAGITAKIINHNVSYVLAVYILNLVIVSANIVVYFVNKRYDRLNSDEIKNIKLEAVSKPTQAISRKAVSE